MAASLPVAVRSRFRCSHQALARDRAGSGAVEFALVLPVLCFLLLGVLQGGLFLGITHALEQISANGSRYALAGLDPVERRLLAQDRVQVEARHYGLIDATRLSVATQEQDGAFTVTLVYDASELPQIAFLGSAIGMPATIERSATLLLP